MKVSLRFPGPEENKPGTRSKGRERGVAETGPASSADKGERQETQAKSRWR